METFIGSVLLILILLSYSTYFVTTCQYIIYPLSQRGKQQEPLTLPYWVPYIGSAIGIWSNAHDLFKSAMKLSGHRPVGLRLGPMYAYLITGSNNVREIFNASKVLSFEFLTLQVLKNVAGLPPGDAKILEDDNSGTDLYPLSDDVGNTRIWRHIHTAQKSQLSKHTSLNILTNKFSDEFFQFINEDIKDPGKTYPIGRFVRDNMFRASTTNLIGSAVFKCHPNLTTDFYELTSGFTSLFFGLPRWIFPKGCDARGRILRSMRQHLTNVTSIYDGIEAADLDWELNLGSKLNRLRDKALIDSGISLEGRASMYLAFMFGTNANAIPLTCWILIESLRVPKLMDRLREEISGAVSISADGIDRLDIQALTSLPLLQSVYTECLRLRVSIIVTRQLRTDLSLSGYTLKAGNAVMLPCWAAHSEAAVWSDRDHPVESFWPERFLATADDGCGKPVFSMSTEPGHFFPFGGGSSICPGRFFAKQEILAAVAIMIAAFEMEVVAFVDEDGAVSARGPESSMENAGTGVLLPDRDIRVRMRRRV